jgi:hypothetical protein
MTFFKALAKYIKANLAIVNESEAEQGLTNEYYPYKPPQKADLPYTVFNIQSDYTETVHNGGYPCGIAIIQFDFFDATISGQDTRVKLLKDAFVGRAFDLDTSVSMAFCESYNEESNFNTLEGLVIRSIDLRIKYIFK